MGKEAFRTREERTKLQSCVGEVDLKIKEQQERLRLVQAREERNLRMYGRNGEKLESFWEGRVNNIVRVRHLNEKIIKY